MSKSKFSLQNKSGKLKVSEKVAQESLVSLLEYYDIDIESIEDTKDKKNTETVFNKIVRFIRLGKIEIKIENGATVTQHLHSKGKLEYKGISAQNKIETDGYKEGDDHGKMYALLGALSCAGTSAILQLKDQDMSAAECIGFVFLQV